MAAVSLKEAGNAAFRRGNWNEAVTCYTEAMKLDPSEYTYPLNRSMAYLKLQRYSEAERDATRSLALQPAGNTKASYRRALARKALNKFDDARADFKQVLADEPNNLTVKGELESLPTQPSTNQDKQSRKPSTPGTTQSPRPAPNTESPTNRQTRGESDDRRATLLSAVSGAKDLPAGQPTKPDTLAAVSTRKLTPSTGPLPPPPPPTTTATKQDATMTKTPAAAAVSQSTKPVAVESARRANDFMSLRAKRQERESSHATLQSVQGEPRQRTDESARTPTPDLPKELPTAPRTTFEFERRMKDAKNPQDRAAIIHALEKEGVSLSDLFGQNLSPEIIDDILQTLRGLSPSQRIVKYYAHGLARCARFDFVSMLCGQGAALRTLLREDDPERAAILEAWGV